MDMFTDIFMVTPGVLVVLLLVAVLAGFIDALAGGGGRVNGACAAGGRE